MSNPSDVAVHGMKLPLQRIVHPVKEKVLAIARAQNPGTPEGELLCGNALFSLQLPEDAPDEITHWEPSEYKP